MEKYNFKDGKKISEATVAIDGKEYTVNPPKYEGTTPISAEVLNNMQNIVENEINTKTADLQDSINTKTADLQDSINTKTAEKSKIIASYSTLPISIIACTAPSGNGSYSFRYSNFTWDDILRNVQPFLYKSQLPEYSLNILYQIGDGFEINNKNSISGIRMRKDAKVRIRIYIYSSNMPSGFIFIVKTDKDTSVDEITSNATILDFFYNSPDDLISSYCSECYANVKQNDNIYLMFYGAQKDKTFSILVPTTRIEIEEI